MLPLPMDPRPASSAFPFAVRARLSTEDSGSDASSFIVDDSDDNSGRDESEEEDDAAEDNAASPRRPFVPIARVTGDEEDSDVIDELVFDDDDEQANPKLAAERLVAERSSEVVDESFGGGVFSGREESELFHGSEKRDGDLGVKGSVIVLEEELQGRGKEKGYVEEVERMAVPIDDAGAVEVGLGLNDVKVEVDGSNFAAAVYEKIGADRYRDVEQSKGFELELKDLVVELSIVDSEKNSLAGDIDSTQNSAMEVELRGLRAESEAGHLVIPEVEDDPPEIVTVGASGAVTSSKHWNEEAEAKTAEEEIGVFEDMEEEASGYISSKIGFLDEKILEASEAEANSTESKGFEATDAVGFSHNQVSETLNLHDSSAFEPEYPEVCAIYMEAEKGEDLYGSVHSVDSEKPKHFTGELLVLTGSVNARGNDSPSKYVSTERTMAYPAQYLDIADEKNDESGVKDISTAENYSSSDNFSPFFGCEKEMESRFDSFYFSHEEDSVEEDEHVISEWPAMVAISENSGFVKHILKEMEEDSSSSQTYSQNLDGQTISNSDEEGETDKDGGAKELLDTSALAALLRASNAASSGKVAHFTCQDTSSVNDMDDEDRMLCSRVQQMRAKYRRLVEMLGHSTDDALPDHVLRQIGLIDLVRRGRRISEEFNLETAEKVIVQLDEGEDDFIFSCTILVLGKTGAGKSAVINSIFGEERAFTDPFQPATTSVREVSGAVDGVYIRLIDTPGLLTSLNDQRSNRKILSSIKKCIRRCPPDIVLYVDRLDAYNRDFNELPMLRMVTNMLGSSIWFNAIIALTHADLAFPDGPDGSSMSYDDVVVRRSKVVQQLIRQAAEDSCLVNSVALVENHSSCRKNIGGESILPNGLRWRPWLLLLCHSSKILSEAYSLMKLEVPSPQKLFPFHSRYPFPVFLSSLSQFKARSNSSTYLGSDNDNHDSDIDFDNLTKAVIEEDDDEYDQPPSFKPPPSESQAEKLTKEQKNAVLI